MGAWALVQILQHAGSFKDAPSATGDTGDGVMLLVSPACQRAAGLVWWLIGGVLLRSRSTRCVERVFFRMLGDRTSCLATLDG